jgi:Tfp pilus assembly protein FimT
MVEMFIVITIMSIVAMFAVLNIEAIIPGIEANTALDLTIAQLRKARELAIAQRRNVEVKFLEGNQIQLVREDVPAGTTVLSTVTLEYNMEFLLFPGVPDTPDVFGNSKAVDFGSSTTHIFLSDGTLVDASGNPLHGSIFLGQEERPETARAVTILGATGRVRGYRWTGTSWIQ